MQNYITLYTAATINVSIAYYIFWVSPKGGDQNVTIGDWRGECAEDSGSYGLLNLQTGFSSTGGYYTKSFGIGASLSNKFPGNIAGGYAGKTYLFGAVTHIDLYNNPNDPRWRGFVT